VGVREQNQQGILKKLRSKEERRLKALYILLCLVVLAILILLSAHAILVGPGSLFWDLSVNFFAIFSVIVLGSGVVFPVLALCAVLALPFILFALYLRNR
jgi:hypothetical protein